MINFSPLQGLFAVNTKGDGEHNAVKIDGELLEYQRWIRSKHGETATANAELSTNYIANANTKGSGAIFGDRRADNTPDQKRKESQSKRTSRIVGDIFGND